MILLTVLLWLPSTLFVITIIVVTVQQRSLDSTSNFYWFVIVIRIITIVITVTIVRILLSLAAKSCCFITLRLHGPLLSIYTITDRCSGLIDSDILCHSKLMMIKMICGDDDNDETLLLSSDRRNASTKSFSSFPPWWPKYAVTNIIPPTLSSGIADNNDLTVTSPDVANLYMGWIFKGLGSTMKNSDEWWMMMVIVR